MPALPKVVIYTDGSCEPNPGPGGWAALLRYGDHEETLKGGELESTNNRMELMAAIQALQALDGPYQVEIFTDSEYLKRGITEWLAGWKQRGWRRKDGALANVELWQALDQVMRPHQISWHWVKGHAGDRYNQRVDQLAKAAIVRSR